MKVTDVDGSFGRICNKNMLRERLELSTSGYVLRTEITLSYETCALPTELSKLGKGYEGIQVDYWALPWTRVMPGLDA